VSRKLALGYAVCIATLAAIIALGRGAVPRLDGITTLFFAGLVGLLFFLAAALCFGGARASQGAVRKLLAYAVAALAGMMGVGSAFAAIIASSSAHFG
jgi:hypothetical protein